MKETKVWTPSSMGQKGGKVTSEKLTKEELRERAMKGVKARQKK